MKESIKCVGAKEEVCNETIVKLAALLHDIAIVNSIWRQR
jgi:HD superfamily phosphodiesterase